MTKLSSVWPGFRLAYFLAFLLLPFATHALSLQDVEAQLTERISQQSHHEENENSDLSAEEIEAFSQLIHLDPDVQNASELTEALTDKAITKAFIGQFDQDEAIPEQLNRLRAFLSFSNETDPMPMAHGFLKAMENSALCEEDTTYGGRSCAFSFSDESTDIDAEIIQSHSNTQREIMPANRSALGYLLPKSCNSERISSPTEISTIGSNNSQAATSASPYCLDSSYGYVLYYRYKCSFWNGCSATAEASGAVTASYLYSTADSVGGVAAAALKCNRSCLFQSALDYFRKNGKIFEYIYKNSSKKYKDVRNNGSKMQYMVTQNCPVLPAPLYSIRPIYTYLNGQNYSLPFDSSIRVKLGTYFQKYNSNSTSRAVVNNQSHNMYPKPTQAHISVPSGSVIQRHSYWQYEFDKTRTFSFNFIYGATDDYNPQNTCASTVNMNNWIPGINKSARGRQHWFWHGAKGPTVEPLPFLTEYALPEINWIIGFNVNRMNSCTN